MSRAKSKPINFMLTALAVASLGACNTTSTPAESEAAAEPMMEKAWTMTGDTYTYDARYERPEGFSEDTFSITVEEGIVTAAMATTEAGGKHQEGLDRFNAALEPVIVGKSLAELEEFDILGKYSLTTAAFNEAVMELQEQVEMES